MGTFAQSRQSAEQQPMRTKVFAFALAVSLIASVAPGWTMPCCRISQLGTIQGSAARHCSMSSEHPVTSPADGTVALIGSVEPGCTMPCCKIPQFGIIQAPAARHCPMLCAQSVTPPAAEVVALTSSNSPALHPLVEVGPAAATIAYIRDLDHNEPPTSSPPALYLLDGAFLI
jgi:hypothetical protein